MDEIGIKRDYKELTNIALEDANRYIQRYYLNKQDAQSEDSGDVCIMIAMRRAIGALMKEINRMTTWIPVVERLPEHDGMYIACFDDDFITAVQLATDRHGVQHWELWADSGDVVAWMPLPEPYNPQN